MLCCAVLCHRVCRAALEAMAAGHFDSDSEACVLTLTKVVDNVLHRPDDARTRQIRCGNAAFHQKVRGRYLKCVCVCAALVW